jgi:hypothetical protein
MKTPVEWLLDNLISEPYSEQDFKHNKECWYKAKEMEHENKLKQWSDTWTSGYLSGWDSAVNKCIETFKNK